MTLPWSKTAVATARDRYLTGEAASIGEWLQRVCRFVCRARPEEERELWAGRYLELLSSRSFLPTSTVLHNALREQTGMAACTVVPLHAEPGQLFRLALPRIVDALLAGAGVGLDLTVLPPQLWGEPERGRAFAGPVQTLRSITQAVDGPVAYAGVKPAAFMGSLFADHPDIFAFTAAKTQYSLRNVNISIAFDAVFAEAVERDGLLPLRWGEDGARRLLEAAELEEMHVRASALGVAPPDLSLTGGVVSSAVAGPGVGSVVGGVVFMSARALLRFAAECAHACGEPGLLNLELINRDNPTHPRYLKTGEDGSGFGVISTTAPCAEQPLLANETCHLGSVNVAAFAAGGILDEAALGRVVGLAVRFLDDVIDCGGATGVTRENRKIGIGMMGLADVLFDLELAYDSEEGRAMASRIARVVRESAVKASRELAQERGPFPNWERTNFFGEEPPRRNATLTSVAPTGYISILADCTPGIEPAYRLEGPAGERGAARAALERKLAGLGFSLDQWAAASGMSLVAGGSLGTLAAFSNAPTGDVGVDAALQALKRVFRTAHEIAPLDHLRMLEAIQPYVDNSISKTINLPQDASVDDVAGLFTESLRRGIKGVTIFRDGSTVMASVPAGGAPLAAGTEA